MNIPKVRIIIVSALFLLSAFFVYGVERDGATPISITLEAFPQNIGEWEAVNTQTMSDEVEEVLGVDDYLLRNYKGPNNIQINLYASYFAYTDRSKGYHSPLNCMPGSGWNIAGTEPVSLAIAESGQGATVNKLILKNGPQKQVSLYWYQCRGRILHNEYVERLYRVLDSIMHNRTDGAFIRLIATNDEQSMEKNIAMLKGFASEIIPILQKHLPD